MIDLGSLFDCFDLPCTACGRLGSDGFRDEAGVAALVGALTNGGIRRIVAADLERFGPVHRQCTKPAWRRRLVPTILLASVR
jgi:hypothetical protein